MPKIRVTRFLPNGMDNPAWSAKAAKQVRYCFRKENNRLKRLVEAREST